MSKKQNNFKFNPPAQKWIIPLTISLGILLFGGLFLITTFCPNFILEKHPKYLNLFEYIEGEFDLARRCAYWTIHGATTFFNIIFGFAFIKTWLVAITYKPWIKKYMNETAKIISSCNSKHFTDKVAILVPTCNDLTENTVLQISNQTYKFVDCWLIDDTWKSEEIKRITKFIDNNPKIKYFRRGDQNRKNHKSAMGNIMAWVEAHGNEYDYICEVNTSSLITNTFVENALCFFHSKLLKNKKVGGVVALGSFFYSNTIISWINATNLQFTLSTFDNSSIRGTGGQEICIRGWGSMYSIEAIKTIDWKKAECSTCDIARGREIVINGYTIWLNPFDFSGKVGIRDMDGYRKQRIKWNEGNVHLWRKKIDYGPWTSKKSFYIKWCAFFHAYAPIIFLITFIMNIITSILGVIMVVDFPNLTSLLFTGCLWAAIWGPFVIIALINRLPIRLMLCQVLAPLVDIGIYYFKLFDTIFTSLILKKWSMKNVTKKTNKNYSFLYKMKLCWKDALWILVITTICLILQFAVHLPPYTIWFRFYITLILPSTLFIVWTFIGEINIKSGWKASRTEWKDFYKVFSLNYKFVKDHPLWKKQHPND